MSTPQQGTQRYGGSTQQQQQQQQQSFTQEMRDRQARGKDPYTKSDDEDESDDESSDDKQPGGGARKLRLGHGFASESFEDRERRAFALSVLDSREQLMMYAQSTSDSIPGQRHRFTAMLCGFDHPPHQGRGNQHTGSAGSRHEQRRRQMHGSRAG